MNIIKNRTEYLKYKNIKNAFNFRFEKPFLFSFKWAIFKYDDKNNPDNYKFYTILLFAIGVTKNFVKYNGPCGFIFSFDILNFKQYDLGEYKPKFLIKMRLRK